MDLSSGDLTALTKRLWGSFLGRCGKRFLRMSGLDRCIVLSSQAFTALIPLLLLVATLAPSGQTNVVASGIIRKFGLTGESAAAVEQLFDIPEGATSTLSGFSVFLLLFSGVSFTRRLQRMYRTAWEREAAGVLGGLFAALGLVALMVEILVLYALSGLVSSLGARWLVTVPLATAAGLVLWTSIPYLLLNRQVHWRRLLFTGGLTALATAIYGVATTIYMPPLVEQYTQEFGLFGITMALIGWLLVIAFILVVGAAIGAEFDASRAPVLVRTKVKLRLLDPDAEPPVVTKADEESGLNTADLVMLGRITVNCLVIAAAVWVATAVVPGIEVPGGFFTYLWVSLLLGLVNAVLGPVLQLVALPLSVLTLGLTAMILNGVLLALTAAISENLNIGGFTSAVLGALVISVVTTVLELVLRPMTRRHQGGALTHVG